MRVALRVLTHAVRELHDRPGLAGRVPPECRDRDAARALEVDAGRVLGGGLAWVVLIGGVLSWVRSSSPPTRTLSTTPARTTALPAQQDDGMTENPAPRAGVVRIGNCSGFYGDRLAAAREMVEGGPIDVLTGDYLAELTMLILFKSRLKDPSRGYATTFLTQMEQVLGDLPGPRHQGGQQRGRAQPVGAGGGAGRAGRAAGAAPCGRVRRRGRPHRPGRRAARRRPPDGAPRHRPAARGRRRHAGDGERLPRRLGHRGRAGGRRRRGGVPAGHRRVARRGPGRVVARLAARRPGRARRSRRRRARHRVRTAGDGRQLRVPGAR